MLEYGNQTIFFKNKPRIIGSYSIVGPKEGLGSLKNYFDYILIVSKKIMIFLNEWFNSLLITE